MKKAVLDTNILVAGQFSLESEYELSITSLSYAELRYGATLPNLTPDIRAHRLARITRIQKSFGAGLPFDDDAASSYSIVTQLVLSSGRKVRGRALDLMIAAIAHSRNAALVTLNIDDFRHLDSLIQLIEP
jgi:predicted nucleic acid-binding protein